MSLKRVLAWLLVLVLLLAIPTVAVYADTVSGVSSGIQLNGVSFGVSPGVTEAGVLSETFENPTDILQYTDASENAKLLYDNGYVILKYKDAAIYPKSVYSSANTPNRIAFPSAYNCTVLIVLSWLSETGVEYIDMFCFFSSYSTDTFSVSIQESTGKVGFYGDNYRLQFCYLDGELVQTACRYSYKSWDYWVDSYCLDTGRFCMCSRNPSGYISIAGIKYYDNAPSPYDFKYKTTFRMLTDGATVYNTYYYDNCYKGGDDIIKCIASANAMNESGRYVVVETVKLADGAKSVTQSSNPTTMCQISSYGTAYDIAYTNDDNLCSLLGIEKPNELRWNVRMQAWVSPAWDDMINGTPDIGDLPETGVINPDGSSPFESAESIPKVNGLSVSTFGQDVQLKYSEYSKLYGDSLMHVSTSPPSAADAWGLGSTLRWSLDGDAGDFEIKLQVVAKISVQLPDGTTKSHQLILQDYDGKHPGNNTAFRVGAADGGVTLALYDLVMTLEEQHKEYVTSPPAKILGVVYYLTPFYYRDGTYYRGTLASTVHSVNKAFVSVPVAPLPTPFDPTGPITDGSLWEAIGSLGDYIRTGIANAVASVGSFFSGVLGSAKSILNDLGDVPALFAAIFSFLPPEIVAAIGVGLSLWLLPALLGLARGGLKALGGICSSFFSLISTFFG